ncbi:MAG: acyl-CoA thioesterase [Clostridia bacterium]|nr:acyl-CoA thioesterase [Clostridia bacterium]
MISITQIVVRYQETDQMGIVHHSVYPVWYEVARTDFCRKMGMSYSKMEEVGLMTPIYEVHSCFKAPAKYEDVLTVEAFLNKISEYRLEFFYRIFKDDILIHTGSTTHVFVGKEDFKLLNIKKRFPEIYDMLKNTVEKEKME